MYGTSTGSGWVTGTSPARYRLHARPVPAPRERLRRERLRGAAPPSELKPPSPLPIGCAARRAPPLPPIRGRRAPFRMFNGHLGTIVSPSAEAARGEAKIVPPPGAACRGGAGSVLSHTRGCRRQARAVTAVPGLSVCALPGGSALVRGGGIRPGGRRGAVRLGGSARERGKGSVGAAPAGSAGAASDGATRSPSAAASAPTDSGTGSRALGDATLGCREEELGRLTPRFLATSPSFCSSSPLPWRLSRPSPPVFTWPVAARSAGL